MLHYKNSVVYLSVVIEGCRQVEAIKEQHYCIIWRSPNLSKKIIIIIIYLSINFRTVKLHQISVLLCPALECGDCKNKHLIISIELKTFWGYKPRVYHSLCHFFYSKIHWQRSSKQHSTKITRMHPHINTSVLLLKTKIMLSHAGWELLILVC